MASADPQACLAGTRNRGGRPRGPARTALSITVPRALTAGIGPAIRGFSAWSSIISSSFSMPMPLGRRDFAEEWLSPPYSSATRPCSCKLAFHANEIRARQVDLVDRDHD